MKFNFLIQELLEKNIRSSASGVWQEHFNTTLASTPQIKVSGLCPREAEWRYRKERPPSAGFPPGARECARPGHASLLKVSPDSCYSLRRYWRRAWILFACKPLYDDPFRPACLTTS